MDVKTLIDAAAKEVGGQVALAKVLDVTPQRVSNWKNGIAACTPEVQYRLAEIGHLDPVKIAGEAVAIRLGKALHSVLLGVVAMLCFGASDRALAAAHTDDQNHAYVYYVKSQASLVDGRSSPATVPKHACAANVPADTLKRW